MTETDGQSPSAMFRVGWWILIVLNGLAVLGHISLLFFIPGEEVLFLGWSIFNLYAFVTLLIPYRRYERWSWYLTWAGIAPFLIIFLFDSSVGAGYAGVGIVMAVSQLLTRSAFFSE